MSLTDTLSDDMKQALKGGDKARLSTLRMALAAIKRAEIDTQRKLDDTAVIALLNKLIKQGREAADQFRGAGREEQAAKEEAEIEIFQSYLPAQLGEAEVDALIAAAIEATGASSPKDMGKVMAAIKQQAAGQVDMGQVSGRVKAKLAGG